MSDQRIQVDLDRQRSRAGGAAAMRSNATAAAAAAGGGNPTCDFCSRVGLPILPLRYAVVPKYLAGSAADATKHLVLGKHLVDKPAGGLKQHDYVLRTLRKGYVMVYFGSGLWHAYVVGEAGHLRQLADPDDPDFANDREMSAQCKREGHNIPASFIHIPPITSGGTRKLPTKIWLAFSDVLWTPAVRKRFEGTGAGSSLRAQRMQEFSTDQLGKQADALPDALQFHAAHEQVGKNLSALVWEYASDASAAENRSHYNSIDSATGTRGRPRWQGAHGLNMRTAEASAVAELAAKPTPSNGEQLMAAAVVLHDPLGMVQELNVTRAQYLESRQNYLSHEKIARPLLISQSIMGLKAFIGEQQRAALTAEETAKGLPDEQTHTVTIGGGGFPGAYVPGETVVYKDTRQERAAAKSSKLWDSLQEHYREADRAKFEKDVASVLKQFTDWLNKADHDYAHWLNQPDWVLRKHDYDPEDPDQQAELVSDFAAALNGGPTNSPESVSPGQEDVKTYEVWVKYLGLDPMAETNPVYVALFGNQKSILEYLLPEGSNPLEDKINKGSKLYKVIKTLIGTTDLTNNTTKAFAEQGTKDLLTRKPADAVPNPARQAGSEALKKLYASKMAQQAGAAAHVVLAIGSALGRASATALTKVHEATALRAIQGAVFLYERREIFLVTTQVRVRDYLAYLNDVAYGAKQSVLLAASQGVRRVSQVGKQTVRSMAVAGVLYIADSKVKDALIDVTVWAHNNLDDVDSAMAEVAPNQAAAQARRTTASAAHAAESAAMLAAMRVHPFSLSPAAAEFVQQVSSRAQALRLGSGKLLSAITRSSLRFARSGSGMIAAASFVVQGWSLKDNIVKADKAFLGSNEARVLVTAAGLAFLGACGEVVGTAGKLAAAKWATAVGRVGGALGALASIVEGVQAWMASRRSFRRGDEDAGYLYGAASVALVAGGVVGIWGALTGAALLGPVGWALALIAAGVILLYFAAKAEDSQAGIWLDRCYWGKGERFKNAGNIADKPWTNSEGNKELSQLNAVILGLSGETGFNDDGWGFADWTWDTVKAKVRFPNYSAADSAFEWRLRAIGMGGAGSRTLAKGEHGQLPDDPNSITVSARRPAARLDTTEYFRNLKGPTYIREADGTLVGEVSVEVRVKYFQDVELTVDYLPDVSDPQGRAILSLSERD